MHKHVKFTSGQEVLQREAWPQSGCGQQTLSVQAGVVASARALESQWSRVQAGRWMSRQGGQLDAQLAPDVAAWLSNKAASAHNLVVFRHRNCYR